MVPTPLSAGMVGSANMQDPDEMRDLLEISCALATRARLLEGAPASVALFGTVFEEDARSVCLP